jgi:hypothetical protein
MAPAAVEMIERGALTGKSRRTLMIGGGLRLAGFIFARSQKT